VWRISRQDRLLCPWAWHLTGACFYLWVIRQVAGGSLTGKLKKFISSSPGEATWQFNEHNQSFYNASLFFFKFFR